MEILRIFRSEARCTYCSHPVTGTGSTTQAAKDHATLLLNTHLKSCSSAPKNIRDNVRVTIRLAPLNSSI